MTNRDVDSIVAQLVALNNAQRGSFGELIFAAVAEAPANLRPSVHQAGRVTVYLDFCDHRIGRDNIRPIIAFSDEGSEELPSLARTRLHLAKVDLKRLPPEFHFAGIYDLKARFAVA